MKRLFLLRHAKAKAGHRDQARPLACRGTRDSFWLGQYLQKIHVLPDLVLCSSAIRAQQTLIRLQTGAVAPFPSRLCDDLYLASAHNIIHRISALEPGIPAAMIIGHNPALSWLFQDLTRNPPQDSRSLKYPTCALAIIDFDLDNWSGVKSNMGRLVDLIIPSDQLKRQKCKKKN